MSTNIVDASALQAFSDEVVTSAKVRLLELPMHAGRMALITLDNGLDHTRPSTFGPAGLASLDLALDQISGMTDIAAVGVTGKPFVFAVGADLSGIDRVTDIRVARAVTELGHAVFRRFGELDVPTFAFVNGAAMGGGLELALHCTYRTVSSGAAALSLPEVFLGLIPGWGGTWLLPNLIGPAAAIEVIVTNSMAQNKQLKPKQALALGIADAMFEPAEYLAQSLHWAAQVLRGDLAVPRPQPDRANWADVVAGARATLNARLHECTPAPWVALDLIAGAAHRTRDEGFVAEDEALSTLMMGDDLRASLYAFNLVQKRARKPAGAPDSALARPVTKVGIVGAGLMASQLALLFVRRLEVPVVITDLDQARIDKGLAYVANEIDSLAKKGRISSDKASRLKALVTGTTDKASFADAEFVIEAVFEELALKQRIFAELEGMVTPTCILATNTSSLSVTDMAAALQHPERVIGFHFFNPVAVMPLLEVARGARTDDPTVATALAVGKQLKKNCVIVKDAPAFVVNRLLARFLGEITDCVDEGTSFDTVEEALHPLGLPLSPFVLLQLVGPAVALHVSETMANAFPDRYSVSPNLRRLVEAGKTGIYVWDAQGQPSVDPEVLALYEVAGSPSTAEQVRTRILDALADETARMLDEGVVAAADDIDLCMILGAGWPFWMGGVTPYLDRTGASERVRGGRFQPVGVASAPN
jgi:3-hydroxyacyl-CoA dehydrogenase/enoyl-CoA hydratase/carnithine racemase